MMKGNLQKKVAIIGAGPTGYIAALTALKLGYKVELIDPWIFAEPSPNEDIDVGVKTRFGSSKMHYYPPEYVGNDNSLTIAATSVVGGFTTIWGAGLSFDKDCFKKEYDDDQINLAEISVREVFQGFDGPHFVSKRFMKLLSKRNNGFSMSQLAISASRCNLSGKCMTGCPETAIWSCEPQWKELVQSQITLQKGFAKTLEEVDNHVHVAVESEKKVEIHKYDYVLVACGAVASASLGQRSGLFPESIEIGETAISYMPIVLLNQIKPYVESRFTLSQVFYSKSTSRENQRIWLSLFEASSFLKEQAELKLGKKFSLIPNRLWGYLGVGIHYSPELLSNKMILDFREGVSVVSVKDAPKRLNRYFWKIFQKIGLDFCRNGILIYPNLRIKGQAGGSYHLGHLTCGGKNLLDTDGKARSDSRVSFVDSLSLSELPTGPITAIAMMNAWLKTISLLTNNPK